MGFFDVLLAKKYGYASVDFYSYFFGRYLSGGSTKTLISISAVYTQGGTVYDNATLDSLKTDLVVTAHYSDSSSTTLSSTDYALSGTLTVGASTVTVSYEGKTTTFTVTVSDSKAILYYKSHAYSSKSASTVVYFGESDVKRIMAYVPTGEHPLSTSSSSYIPSSAYPIPIPENAVSVTTSVDADIETGSVQILQWNGTTWIKVAGIGSYSDAGGKTTDISSYNSGSYCVGLNFRSTSNNNITSRDTSTWTVTFNY